MTSDLDRIRRVNDAVQAGDIQAVTEVLNPEVVWEHNLGVGSPEEGVYRGRDSVVTLFERIVEPWESLRPEPHEVRDLGGGAFAVWGQLHAKHATSATEMVSHYVQRLQLDDDGLLVRASMVTGEDLEWEAGDIDVVRQVVEAFRDRDVARLRMIFEEQSEFISSLTGLEGTPYRFPGDLERYMSDLDAAFDDWHTEEERYFDAGGGRVILAYRILGRDKGSGAPIDRELAILWTVRDGRVQGGRVYHDRDEALEVAGVR